MLLQLIKNDEPLFFSSEDIYIPSIKKTLDAYLVEIKSKLGTEESKEQDIDGLALLVQQEQEKNNQRFDSLVNFLQSKYPTNFPYCMLYNWSDIPESYINSVLTSHYNGDINIADYWHVGDERIYTYTTQSSSSTFTTLFIHFVILDFNKDNLVTSISGKTKSAMTLGYYITQNLNDPPLFTVNFKYRAETTQAFPTNYTGIWTPYANSNFCYLSMYDRFHNRQTGEPLINEDFLLYDYIKEVSKKTASKSTTLSTEDLVFPPSFSEVAGDIQQIAGEETVYSFFTGPNSQSKKILTRLFSPITHPTTGNVYLYPNTLNIETKYSGLCPISIRSNCTDHDIEKELRIARDVKFNVSYAIDEPSYFIERGNFNFFCFNI